jgi:Rha family phage regulatory protein
VVNTRDLAADPELGKRHANILRDVDNLLKSLTNSDLSWFNPVEYEDDKGEMRPSYDITKDGFTLLAMGWTGPKWTAAKVAYIQRFNAMEAALRDANRAASQIGDLAKQSQDRTQAILEQNATQLANLGNIVASGFNGVNNEFRVVHARLDGFERRLPDIRSPTKGNRVTFAKIVAKFYNRKCPCGCCGKVIVNTDGTPNPDFVIDHKEGRGQNAPHQLWPQHKTCNMEYDKKGRVRDRDRMAAFEINRQNFEDQPDLFAA